MKLFKKDIIETFSKATGLAPAASKVYVDTVFEIMSEAMKKGNDVQITDFGTFKVKEVAKRKYILNGEKVTAPKYKTVRFTCGAGLKAIVNKKKKK